MCPDFPIILALRDPVECAYSNHLHMGLGYLKGPGVSFEYVLENNAIYVGPSRYPFHWVSGVGRKWR